MSTSLHIGKTRTETFTASDGSTPTGVTGVSQSTPLVTVSGNTITGVAAGSTTVVWSANGYQSFSQFVVVTPLPTLIATDGPEV